MHAVLPWRGDDGSIVDDVTQRSSKGRFPLRARCRTGAALAAEAIAAILDWARSRRRAARSRPPAIASSRAHPRGDSTGRSGAFHVADDRVPQAPRRGDDRGAIRRDVRLSTTRWPGQAGEPVTDGLAPVGRLDAATSGCYS
jgi:hypothetical protein